MIEYQALFRSEDLQEWQKLYEENTPIGRAIAEFREFVQDYSNYFEGVISRKEFDRTETTAERLRSRMCQALEDYWAPLGEVAMQRQIKHYRKILDRGVEQAQAYQNKLGLSDVLIYFNKVAAIKYCPYTSIPFIGTPYTLSAAGDWMAIPHELGHHLYWNLGGDLGDTRERHQAIEKEAINELKEKGVPEPQRNMLLPWLEETFCDLVGTRIGGVKFIESLKKLIESAAGNVDDITADDGRHPPLCLRAFVREHTQRLRGETPDGDWDNFFKLTFEKSVAELNLEVPLPNPEDIVRAMSKEELLSMLKAKEPLKTMSSPQFQSVPLDQIISATKVMVEYLNTQIDGALETFETRSPTHRADTFEQLLDLASDDAESRRKRPYEILLRPSILERGEQHGPHGCWGHFQYHTVGVHNH